ncbi:hypothetical protein P3T76_009638 [Phytophthora citrophthora]|uniref:Uncharacterized protein n=1 Tax=Phytophthora citrophthora TaxID=4793 RepID=A0AAD9GG58_9STRA|nr:hypothetical protein P3T76_009638 [Phytophthora citrophthora]
MKKETMLRLLLLHEFETVDAWAEALTDDGEGIYAADNVEKDREEQRGLITAIDEVVPYLPDYSALLVKLKALMMLVSDTYSSQVNQLVQGWLQQNGHSAQFRKWVICDWLKCSHVLSEDPNELVQWRYALVVAVTNENVKLLKRTLLGLLNTVNEAIEAHVEVGKNDEVETKISSAQLETVEELLEFFFLHAEQLSSCSLLCAAKLHALTARTQKSAVKLAEGDGVQVRLRWSLMLKRVLFKPLLEHSIAMKTVSCNMMASSLWTSEVLGHLVSLVDLSSQEVFLEEMKAGRDKLEQAFASGTEHIHVTMSKAKDRSTAEAAVGEYLLSISVEKRKLLIEELERDLDEAPSYLFRHVWMFFELVLGVLLSLPTSEDNNLVITQAIRMLFAILGYRSHDAGSCLDIVGVLLRLQLGVNSIWLDNPLLYLETIESLVESATLQVDPKVKWAAKITLHQLLFECDVDVLQQTQLDLPKLLSPRTMRLVSIRLDN